MASIRKLVYKYRDLQSRFGHTATLKLLTNRVTDKLKSRLPSKNSQVFFSPWNTPFSDRINSLQVSDKKNVVFFYPAADQGTFRYRVYNMCQVINGNLADYNSTYFFANEVDLFLNSTPNYSLLILSRCDWTESLQRLIDAAKGKDIKVIYDTDDLVFDTDYLPLIAEQLQISKLDLPVWKDTIERNYKAASLADSLLCTNTYLAQKLTIKLGKQASVIPNFLNHEQVSFAEGFQRPESDKFWIGYFSGTKSHNRDFELISSSLVEVMRKYSNIGLRLVGHVQLPKELQKYSDRIEIHPFQDFLSYLGIIGSCDIILVPLVINDFTNCKSELKFFEAGLMSVPIIASPTFIYTQVISDSVNGLLAKPGDWTDKISRIYENSDLRSSLTTAARSTSIQNYYGQTIINRLKSFLDQA